MGPGTATDLPQAVAAWLKKSGHGDVIAAERATGGCIHNGRRLATAAGASFFLKTNPAVPDDLFETEADGLREIAASDCVRVPEVHLVGRDFLLLEDLDPAPRRADYWEQLGRALAGMHARTAPTFGFRNDNYLGSTPQPNGRTPNGYEFFARKRLGYQADLAVRRGLLARADAERVKTLAGRLNELIPQQPASLIHGDLWSGNLLADSNGDPALIDPAAHFGWCEADLGMMVLFGSPPERFFRAYEEINPRPPGLHDRFPIYNLYHLLNHLNIFGRGYHAQVLAVIERFG